MSGFNLVVELFVAGFAGCQVVEAWHHGSLFQHIRAGMTARRHDKSRPWPVRKLCELLTCPFCLSHWACLGCVAVLFLTDWHSLWRIPIYGFAVTRIAQLLNDVTHGVTRSPDSELTIEVDETDEFSVVDNPEEQ